MIDPLFDADMTGTIATSRHEAVRYRAGPSYGETFSEDEHYDGLSLTLEVSGTADAEAMLAAIAKPAAAHTLEDGTDVLKLAGFMDACGVENAGSATENEQATSYLFRGATAIRALNAELAAVKKHEKILSDELDSAEEEAASYDNDYAELEAKLAAAEAKLALVEPAMAFAMQHWQGDYFSAVCSIDAPKIHAALTAAATAFKAPDPQPKKR